MHHTYTCTNGVFSFKTSRLEPDENGEVTNATKRFASSPFSELGPGNSAYHKATVKGIMELTKLPPMATCKNCQQVLLYSALKKTPLNASTKYIYA